MAMLKRQGLGLMRVFLVLVGVSALCSVALGTRKGNAALDQRSHRHRHPGMIHLSYYHLSNLMHLYLIQLLLLLAIPWRHPSVTDHRMLLLATEQPHCNKGWVPCWKKTASGSAWHHPPTFSQLGFELVTNNSKSASSVHEVAAPHPLLNSVCWKYSQETNCIIHSLNTVT